MDKIAELKQQLKDAQQAQADIRVKERLDDMREQSLGMCLSTHLLNRKMTGKQQFQFNVIKVIDVKYTEGNYQEYQYVYETVSVLKYGDTFKVTIQEATDADIAAVFIHSITEQQFNHVKNVMQTGLIDTVDSLRFDFKNDNYANYLENDKMRRITKHFDRIKTPYIDMIDAFYLSELLQSLGYPYLVNAKLYLLSNWDVILDGIISDLKGAGTNWNTVLSAATNKKITALEQFKQAIIKL